MMRTLFVPLLLAAAAAPAVAADRTGYTAIASGNLTAAESVLVAERRIYPHRPELMLNLAAIYARTDRADAARTLYEAVLARPAVSVEMPSGNVASSHVVARRGLGMAQPAVYATR